jgi:hypothetical protein|tara:strand:+ start:184 stop:1344 length:1161 start_codon:yes stop_codon:yes gene_type:complete
MATTSSIKEIHEQLQEHVPKGFTCQFVSWEDCNRGFNKNGSLSCLGSNITDVRLYTESGSKLFVVRPENWNERLGEVKTNEFCIIHGNEMVGNELSPITLKNYLDNFGFHGKNHGIKSCGLGQPGVETLSVRFQTCFIPLETEEQFYVELYNYQTKYAEDPKNQVLLCTAQGTAIHQNKPGAHKIEHQAVDGSGKLHGYLLKATASKCPVGMPQEESPEDITKAISEGTASSTVIGIKSMGKRFNAVIVVQIPIGEKIRTRGLSFGADGFGQSRGFTSSARVSMGKEVSVSKCSNKNPVRNPSEQISATITFYNAVQNGVPTLEDINAAIDDIDNLYKSCDLDILRADSSFCNSELNESILTQIQEVVDKYPYKPSAVKNNGVFPL